MTLSIEDNAPFHGHDKSEHLAGLWPALTVVFVNLTIFRNKDGLFLVTYE